MRIIKKFFTQKSKSKNNKKKFCSKKTFFYSIFLRTSSNIHNQKQILMHINALEVLQATAYISFHLFLVYSILCIGN